MLLYYAAHSAAEADRIVATDFATDDRVTVQLPFALYVFGILVSTELDPRSGFTIELELSLPPDYLEWHELTSPVAGVRYYILAHDVTAAGKRRRVSDVEIRQARVAGMEKWINAPPFPCAENLAIARERTSSSPLNPVSSPGLRSPPPPG